MEVNNELKGPARWRQSAAEFRKPRIVVICGMMCALAVVLSMVASINLGPYLRIGFSGLPNQAVAYLYGPVVGGIFGGVLDIVKYLIKPTGEFFPGFTVSAILGGVIYGAMLYKRKATLLRVFLAQLIVKVFVNIGCNTLWLKILYGQGLFAILPARVVSNAVMLPVDTAIMYFMLRMIDRIARTHPADDRAGNQI